MEKTIHNHINDAFHKHGRYYNELPYFTRKQNPEANAAYNQRTVEIENLFRSDIEQEYGVDKLPEKVRDAIYSKAWADGHAYGFGEVYSYYIDLVEFVNVIKKGFGVK